MLDAQDRTATSWNLLNDIWDRTRPEWRGVTADTFTSQFWWQFEQDIGAYQSALAELSEAIDMALRVADYTD